MRTLVTGAAALNTTPLDWEGNGAVVLAAVAAARSAGVGLLCLPELAVTGYGCEDSFHAPHLQRAALAVLRDEVVPATSGIAVAVGLPLFFRGAVYNVTALAADGELRGFVAKQHLAGDGVHYEPRFFKPWPKGVVVRYRLPGDGGGGEGGEGGGAGRAEVPLGDLLFDLEGVRVGFEICEDAWVAARPGAAHAHQGADVILNPSASHFAFGKRGTRERFVVEGSRAFNCVYTYANLLGNEAGRTIYDGDCMIASGGRLLAAGSRFSYRPWELTTAAADLDANQVARTRVTSFEPDLAPRENVVAVDFDPCAASRGAAGAGAGVGAGAPPVAEAFESAPDLKEEEFTRAVSLGLFDYLRKSGARGYTVSLSGGADSAACATLVALMVEAAAEGNPERFREVTGLDPAAPRRELVAQLLTCVYQGTANSGAATRAAAEAVAGGLGARFHDFDVQPLVDAYEDLLTGALSRPLDWGRENDDIVRQNIQARARAPAVWSLANAAGHLLIATSNRSEAAVGYCTMDGDTAGGLSPIGGIDKDFLLTWLRWAQEHRLPELEAVLALEPTAELRPAGAGQTDEGDLMPYDLLNAIQKAAVIDKQSPLEIFRRLRASGRADPASPAAGIGARQLAAHLERYFTLWSRNQWKRERYAPSFHLDDENLDPRSWCRYPILSGGYRRELAALAAAAAGEAGEGE